MRGADYLDFGAMQAKIWIIYETMNNVYIPEKT